MTIPNKRDFLLPMLSEMAPYKYWPMPKDNKNKEIVNCAWVSVEFKPIAIFGKEGE